MKALADAEKIEKLKKPTAYTTIMRAQAYFNANKEEKGLRVIEQYAQANPSNIAIQLARGDSYAAAGKDDEALRIYNDVLQHNPTYAKTYAVLYAYYLQRGDSATGESYIYSALQQSQIGLDDKINILRVLSKNIHANDNKDERARILTILDDLSRQYPLEEEIHGIYANYLDATDVVEDSIANREWHIILDLNPYSAEAWGALTSDALRKDDAQRLISITDSATHYLPDDYRWYLYQTIGYILLHDYEKAIDASRRGQQCVAADENMPAQQRSMMYSTFYQNMGDAYYELSQSDSSYYYYEQSLSYMPDNIGLLNNYAYHLALDSMDLSRAEQMSAKTIQAEADNATYLDTYAWVLFRRGNLTLARFYIQRAVDNLTPQQANDPDVWEHYTTIMELSGHADAAATGRQRLLEALQKAAGLDVLDSDEHETK